MLLNTPIRISKNAPGPHVLDQLAAYLDYELPEDQRAVVREHLQAPRPCWCYPTLKSEPVHFAAARPASTGV